MESRSVNNKALCEAVIAGNLADFKRLVDGGVSLYSEAVVHDDGSVTRYYSPLTVAIKHNRKAMVQRLMSLMTQWPSYPNGSRLHSQKLIDALNHPSAARVYNKEHYSPFRGKLRDCLAEGLSMGVYRLIASGVNKQTLKWAAQDIALLLSGVKLLQGRGGYFGTGDKKTAAIAIEKLLELLQFVVRVTSDHPDERCSMYYVFLKAIQEFNLAMIETLLKVIVNHPTEAQEGKTIYDPLITQLKAADESGVYRKFYGHNTERSNGERKALKKVLRESLASALTLHVNRLIEGGDIAALRAEKEGLTTLSKEVRLLQGKGGFAKVSKKKRAMIAIEALIANLQDRIQSLENATGAGPDALIQAAMSGELTKVEALLAAGVPVDSQNSQGYTPLYYAIKHKHGEVVNRLLLNGAQTDFNLNDGKTYKLAALNMAVYDYNLDMVKLLLELRPTLINQQMKDGSTALIIAMNRCSIDAAKYLIEQGANIYLARRGEGCKTPLDIAVGQPRTGMISVIVAAIDTKIRSFIPDHYAGLIEHLNAEKRNYSLSDELRKKIRLLLTAALNERVRALIADINADFQAERDGLVMIKDGLDIIQKKKGEREEKHAMIEIQDLIKALDEKIANPQATPVIQPPRAEKKSFIGGFFGGGSRLPVVQVQDEKLSSPEYKSATQFHGLDL